MLAMDLDPVESSRSEREVEGDGCVETIERDDGGVVEDYGEIVDDIGQSSSRYATPVEYPHELTDALSTVPQGCAFLEVLPKSVRRRMYMHLLDREPIIVFCPHKAQRRRRFIKKFAPLWKSTRSDPTYSLQSGQLLSKEDLRFAQTCCLIQTEVLALMYETRRLVIIGFHARNSKDRLTDMELPRPALLRHFQQIEFRYLCGSMYSDKAWVDRQVDAIEDILDAYPHLSGQIVIVCSTERALQWRQMLLSIQAFSSRGLFTEELPVQICTAMQLPSSVELNKLYHGDLPMEYEEYCRQMAKTRQDVLRLLHAHHRRPPYALYSRSQTTSATPAQGSAFLTKFPCEIRCMVYEYVFYDFGGLTFDQSSDRAWNCEKPYGQVCPSLLYTCRQIWREARYFAFQVNSTNIAIPHGLLKRGINSGACAFEYYICSRWGSEEVLRHCRQINIHYQVSNNGSRYWFLVEEIERLQAIIEHFPRLRVALLLWIDEDDVNGDFYELCDEFMYASRNNLFNKRIVPGLSIDEEVGCYHELVFRDGDTEEDRDHAWNQNESIVDLGRIIDDIWYNDCEAGLPGNGIISFLDADAEVVAPVESMELKESENEAKCLFKDKDDCEAGIPGNGIVSPSDAEAVDSVELEGSEYSFHKCPFRGKDLQYGYLWTW